MLRAPTAPEPEPCPAGPAARDPPSAAALAGEEVAKVFRRFDANGDGRISAGELQKVVLALGSGDGSPEEVAKMMAEMDVDGDGSVDQEEFAGFFARHSATADEDAQLMDAFRVYDLDGNGKISASELHRVMRRIGEKCSLGDCKRMIKSVDADGDGCVDFGEFKRLMAGAGRKGQR